MFPSSSIGSGSNERWSIGSDVSTSALTTGNEDYSETYYHQFLQTLSYQVLSGGSPSAPTATGTYLGSPYFTSITTSATGYWFDASGSITFSTLTGVLGEQWTPNPTSISAASANTQILNMQHQYYLTVGTNFGSATISGWHNAGSNVDISATAPSVVSGEQYVWNGWTGSGSGSFNGIDNPTVSELTLNGPINEVASWTHQYYLTVTSTHGTTSGQGWYDAGASALFSVSSQDIQGTTKYIFIFWSGDSSSSSDSDSITMDAAKSVTANWKTQFEVSFVVNGLDSSAVQIRF